MSGNFYSTNLCLSVQLYRFKTVLNENKYTFFKSTVFTLRTGFQESCQGVNLQNPSRNVSVANHKSQNYDLHD